MSYSRWSNSVWYSFWNAASSNDDDADGQILSLWHKSPRSDGGNMHNDYSYSEIKNWDVDNVKEHYAGITNAQAIEAIEIIKCFTEDVDNVMKDIKNNK